MGRSLSGTVIWSSLEKPQDCRIQEMKPLDVICGRQNLAYPPQALSASSASSSSAPELQSMSRGHTPFGCVHYEQLGS